MNKSVIEVTPKTMFGYALFIIGIILLGYIATQCFFLANGTVDPLKIEIEETILKDDMAVFLGIFLQLGMYALLIVIAFVLLKTGLNIAKTKS